MPILLTRLQEIFRQIRDHLFELLIGGLDPFNFVQNFLIIRYIQIGIHGSDDVPGISHVRECLVKEVPVVKNKHKVVFRFYFFSHEAPLGEGIAHNSDQHVKEVNEHQE